MRVRGTLFSLVVFSLIWASASSTLSSWLRIKSVAQTSNGALLVAAASFIALIVLSGWIRNKKQTTVIVLAAGILLLAGIAGWVAYDNTYIDEQIRGVSSQDSQVRYSAAMKLGFKKADRAVEPLLAAL